MQPFLRLIRHPTQRTRVKARPRPTPRVRAKESARRTTSIVVPSTESPLRTQPQRGSRLFETVLLEKNDGKDEEQHKMSGPLHAVLPVLCLKTTRVPGDKMTHTQDESGDAFG
jgi:hypothetical protein